MNEHETFQMHCRFCYQKFEADSYEAALAKVQEHEATPHKLGTVAPPERSKNLTDT